MTSSFGRRLARNLRRRHGDDGRRHAADVRGGPTTRQQRGALGVDGQHRRFAARDAGRTQGRPITVPVGQATLGRLFNVTGDPIDNKGELDTRTRRSTAGRRLSRNRARRRSCLKRALGHRPDRPSPRRQTGIFGGAGVGKTVVIRGDPQCGRVPQRLFRVRRVGERSREGNDLMRDDRVGRHRVDRDGLRPDERAAGARVGLTGVTMAEYFRDEAATCCSSSTTSSASYRPAPRFRRCWDACQRRRLCAYAGHGYGRVAGAITSTRKGAITSMQAVYVPADDYTDPRRRRRSPT